MAKKNGRNDGFKNLELRKGGNSLPTKEGVDEESIKETIEKREEFKNDVKKETVVKSLEAQKKGEGILHQPPKGYDYANYKKGQNERAEQMSKNVEIKNEKEAQGKSKMAAVKTSLISTGIAKLKEKLSKPKSEKPLLEKEVNPIKGISKAKAVMQKLAPVKTKNIPKKPPSRTK